MSSAPSAPVPGEIAEFTPSPSYAEDGTVYASGTEACAPMVRCAVLYRSTDRGATWQRLPADGRREGRILLAPAYPRDNRIFSSSAVDLQVSDDGGATFRTVTVTSGPATMSPLFSSGDPRILFGVPILPFSPGTGTEYREGDLTVRPLSFAFPAGAKPVTFAFGRTHATDGHLLVGGLQVDSRGSATSAVFVCKWATCAHTVDFRIVNGAPNLMPGEQGQATVAWMPFNLYRSVDGGRSFVEVRRPGTDEFRFIRTMARAPDGRLFAGVGENGAGKLFVSSDDGDTWTRAGRASLEVELKHVTVLPDGTLLAAPVLDARGGGGIRCSTDDGSTWAQGCARP